MGDNITQCCAITGCSAEVATRMLEACAGNLEMAINMHLEGSLPSGPEGAAFEPDDAEGVRAPIPQRTEMLVEENYQYGFRNRRRKATSVFDGFRDFQAEAKHQEEHQKALAAAASASAPSGASTSRLPTAATSTTTAAASKRKTLEDLFRPPIELLHHGSFQSARDLGCASNKWVLVNIQNVQEFQCQALNRDVWSNRTVKDMVKRSFVFWQVYHDSGEGEKFTKFYPIAEWPYVAIIDPRTGEKMVTWRKMDALTFCDLAGEFLSENPSPEGEEESESPPSKKSKSLVEASEDSQLEAAIRASLTHQASSNVAPFEDDTDDDELETFTDSEEDEQDGFQAPAAVKFQDTPDLEASSSLDDSFCTSTFTSEDNSLSPAENNDPSKVPFARKRTADGTIKTSPLNSEKEGDTDSKDTLERKENGTDKDEKWKFYLGSSEDEQTKLVLRLPNGTRKQLDIPCTSRLMALVQYVIEEGFSSDRFELVTTFPRRKLSTMDFDLTLKEIGVHPQETIFVQER